MSRDFDDDDDGLERITKRVSAQGRITLHDIAEIVGGQLKRQRVELVKHMERRFKVLELNQPSDEARLKNLHRRISLLESEVRLMKKGARP